ncbi:hypothetical protein V6Z93_005092 [Aspergillus fumigatus]
MEESPCDSQFGLEKMQEGTIGPSSLICLGAARSPEQRYCECCPSFMDGGVWSSLPNHALLQPQYPGMAYPLPLAEEAAGNVGPSYAHLRYVPFYYQQNYTLYQAYGAPNQPLSSHIPVFESPLPCPSAAWDPRYYNRNHYPWGTQHCLQCLSADISQPHWSRYHDVRMRRNNLPNLGSRRARWQASKSTYQSSGYQLDDLRCLPIKAAWTTVRRPRQEPKISRFAIWVGNIPRDAGIIELLNHFSREAAEDIQSVFLIIKSQCAFVNYETETACCTALSRFDGSTLRGKRLVCRLRKGVRPSAVRTGAPVSGCTGSLESGGDDSRSSETEASTTRYSAHRITDRYFIMKSHTVEHLEMSRKTGVWATQTHNQDSLNQAFKESLNVFLIFSANQSGEFYGYARMMSPITEDESLSMEMESQPSLDTVQTEEVEVTPTPATSTLPAGRIIRDSVHRTVSWEVNSVAEDHQTTRTDADTEAIPTTPSKRRPFRVQWQSTSRVPFHRTLGLRNLWNANRKVKICRDGTEVEPQVGKILINLFQAG